MAFHPEGTRTGKARALKEQRVRQGRAHAALVYVGSECVGWCQFGPTEELPRIKHRRSYEEGAQSPPRWRITCFFVDRDHRHQGVAAAALGGALREIALLGGGTVESYPQDVAGPTSGSFLYNSTLSMFEQHGFRRVRRLGKNHWVVRRIVRRAPGKSTESGGP
jgi:GNAT superfamily N-acetyltransferase